MDTSTPRQLTLVAFMQAQNCSNYPASWRHAAAAPDETPAPASDSPRDRPTQTFQLPDLSSPPTPESRNAATMTFQLPTLPGQERRPGRIRAHP